MACIHHILVNLEVFINFQIDWTKFVWLHSVGFLINYISIAANWLELILVDVDNYKIII